MTTCRDNYFPYCLFKKSWSIYILSNYKNLIKYMYIVQCTCSGYPDGVVWPGSDRNRVHRVREDLSLRPAPHHVLSWTGKQHCQLPTRTNCPQEGSNWTKNQIERYAIIDKSSDVDSVPVGSAFIWVRWSGSGFIWRKLYFFESEPKKVANKVKIWKQYFFLTF